MLYILINWVSEWISGLNSTKANGLDVTGFKMIKLANTDLAPYSREQKHKDNDIPYLIKMASIYSIHKISQNLTQQTIKPSVLNQSHQKIWKTGWYSLSGIIDFTPSNQDSGKS